MNKIALVTGASSGIGKETVKEFLRAGYKVYAAARRVEAMKDLESKGARVLPLDLTDSASIQRCLQQILDTDGKIDVLVNNAGYGAYGAVEDVPSEEARRQFEVNLFGMAELIKGVLPAMRSRRAGRIIIVGSIGGKVWSLLGAWYQATKFALEGFSDCLRNELRPFGIQVVLIEPGSIKTEWAQVAVDKMQEFSARGAYGKLAEIAGEFYLKTTEQMGAKPEVVARTIFKAAANKNPKARYVTPQHAQAIVFLRWLLPDAWFDVLWRRFYQMPEVL